jgi:FAD synthase
MRLRGPRTIKKSGFFAPVAKVGLNIGGTGGEKHNRSIQLLILRPEAKITGPELEVSLLEYLRPKTSVAGFTEQIARDALWAKEMNDMESRAEEDVSFCEVDFDYVSP